MPATDVVTISRSNKRSGNTDKRYPTSVLVIPAKIARDIPDKQKYQCVPSDDGALVFIPVSEDD